MARDDEKFPLHHAWVLSHDVYFANRQVLARVADVPSLWRYLNNIPTPGELPHKHSYRWFRENIDPESEHPGNAKGGHWIISFQPDSKHSSAVFLNVLLAVFGQTLVEGDPDHVTGVVASRRYRGDRVSVWTAGPSARSIGSSLRSIVDESDPTATIVFKMHNSAVGNSAFTAAVVHTA